jgi:hypothetical protein
LPGLGPLLALAWVVAAVRGKAWQRLLTLTGAVVLVYDAIALFLLFLDFDAIRPVPCW